MSKRQKSIKRNKKKDAAKTGKTKIKKSKIFVLFLVAIVFSVLATEIVYILHEIRYVKVLNAKFEIGSSVGFALGEEKQDIIKFGIVTPGGSGMRFVTVQNLEDSDLSANTIVLGGIKKFLAYEKNFILSVNETKMLEFVVSVPENMKKGNFSGIILLVFKRV